MIGFRASFAPLLAVLVFAVCAGIIWLAHIEAGEMTDDRRPPLVKASAIPLKRSPEDPGGRAVADLGGVGDLLREQPAEAEEQLLPRTELPVSPSDGDDGGAASGRGAGTEAQVALEALVAEIRRDEPPEREANSDAPRPDIPVNDPSASRSTDAGTAPSSVASPSERDDGPAVEEQPVETDIATASPVIAANTDGRFRVQLAAVRGEEDAKRAWSAFQQQLGSIVTGLQPFFERAETGNGIFYRVQVGPFAETTEADRLCVELKKQNASCFVVSR